MRLPGQSSRLFRDAKRFIGGKANKSFCFFGRLSYKIKL